MKFPREQYETFDSKLMRNFDFVVVVVVVVVFHHGEVYEKDDAHCFRKGNERLIFKSER